MTGELNLMIGTQWGDEGKGGHTSREAMQHDYVARANGGANAGHTNMHNGHEVNTHQIPSGIFHPEVINVISQGALLDPVSLSIEAEEIESKTGIEIAPGRLYVSDSAHLVLPHHIWADRLTESGEKKQGTTSKGIRFAAEAKYGRHNARSEMITDDPEGLRAIALDGMMVINDRRRDKGLEELPVEESYAEWWLHAERMGPYLVDSAALLDEALKNGARVLGEGAQSIGLDIEEGIYPLGTSSHTTPGGLLNGMGLSHEYLNSVWGVAKLTMSRVGGTPGSVFPTKITDPELVARLRGQPGAPDYEAGKSTGRERDMGYFDINQLRRAARVGIQQLIITKFDCAERFGDSMKVAIAYDLDGTRETVTPNSAAKLAKCVPIYEELKTWSGDISDVRKLKDLPSAAQDFISFVEDQVMREVVVVGVGPEADQIAVK